MSTKTELLKYLDENRGTFVSGEKLAKELGISRAAVNKAARSLRKTGYKIYSRTSQGYCIREKTDILSEASLEALIEGTARVKLFDSIASTANYAKTLEVGTVPTVILANSQSSGKDEMGRPFADAANSALHISVAFKPNFDLDKSPFITMATAVAVCHAIDKVCGISPKIKWVNDLYYSTRKICNISTEAQTSLESGRINSLIISMNVNCFPGSYPEDLAELSGAISEDPTAFSRTELAAELINNILTMLSNLTDMSFITEYRRRCFILGKGILIHPLNQGRPIKARAIDIDDNGGLVVEYMEGLRMREMETLLSGEVTLREEMY